MIPAIDVLEGGPSAFERAGVTPSRSRAETLSGLHDGSWPKARNASTSSISTAHSQARRRPDLLARLSAVGVPIQVGGGFRTVESIAHALDAGADRVMVGTAALTPGFLATAVSAAGDRLVVAIDARHGRVSVNGWTETTDLRRESSPAGARPRASPACSSRARPATDRSRGRPRGLLAEVMLESVPVMAAGGIGSLDDLRTLRDLDCEAAVVGSALLAGRFTLRGSAVDAVSGH